MSPPVLAELCEGARSTERRERRHRPRNEDVGDVGAGEGAKVERVGLVVVELVQTLLVAADEVLRQDLPVTEAQVLAHKLQHRAKLSGNYYTTTTCN